MTIMRKHLWPLTLTAATVAAIASSIAASNLVNPLPEHVGEGTPLSGQVRSTDEGVMEGVLVSARKDDSTITITVVSDEQGRYRFPSDKLGSGHYTLKIRAAGYDLDGPKSADVSGARATVADLRLKKTDNLVPQLTDAEWLLSVPGTEDQKKQLFGCTNCHTLERTLRSRHNAQEMMQVLERMAGYANQSFPLHPQRRVSPPNLVRRFGAGTD